MKSSRLAPNVHRFATLRSSLTVGLPLAVLWGLHAASNYVPGTGFLRLPILFVIAAGFLAWRMTTAGTHRPGHQTDHGVTIGLSCWFIAASLSTILNWSTDQVGLTYVVVFLAGGAIFVGLSGIVCTPAALDIAVVGLAAGALFPLIGGLAAFRGEWGNPDVTTTITAWQNIARMNNYTDATFGNRGNTAGFLIIITPMLLAVLLDGRKRLALRAFCGAMMVPIALNLMILQVRSGFITLVAAFVAVWGFKLGVRRLPLILAAFVLGWFVLFQVRPDVGLMLTDRILPALTVDTEGDVAVQARADAITEGVRIAGRNWLLGVGPGGALTTHSQASAHQFHVQQAMETGPLGFIGVLLVSIGLFVALFRTIRRGSGDDLNDTRFALLIGPASFMVYAIIANAALANGSVNTWTVLTASMLALAPPFERAPGRVPLPARATRVRRSLLRPPATGLEARTS